MKVKIYRSVYTSVPKDVSFKNLDGLQFAAFSEEVSNFGFKPSSLPDEVSRAFWIEKDYAVIGIRTFSAEARDFAGRKGIHIKEFFAVENWQSIVDFKTILSEVEKSAFKDVDKFVDWLRGRKKSGKDKWWIVEPLEVDVPAERTLKVEDVETAEKICGSGDEVVVSDGEFERFADAVSLFPSGERKSVKVVSSQSVKPSEFSPSVKLADYWKALRFADGKTINIDFLNDLYLVSLRSIPAEKMLGGEVKECVDVFVKANMEHFKSSTADVIPSSLFDVVDTFSIYLAEIMKKTGLSQELAVSFSNGILRAVSQRPESVDSFSPETLKKYPIPAFQMIDDLKKEKFLPVKDLIRKLDKEIVGNFLISVLSAETSISKLFEKLSLSGSKKLEEVEEMTIEIPIDSRGMWLKELLIKTAIGVIRDGVVGRQIGEELWEMEFMKKVPMRKLKDFVRLGAFAFALKRKEFESDWFKKIFDVNAKWVVGMPFKKFGSLNEFRDFLVKKVKLDENAVEQVVGVMRETGLIEGEIFNPILRDKDVFKVLWLVVAYIFIYKKGGEISAVKKSLPDLKKKMPKDVRRAVESVESVV